MNFLISAETDSLNGRTCRALLIALLQRAQVNPVACKLAGKLGEYREAHRQDQQGKNNSFHHFRLKLQIGFAPYKG